MRFPWASWRTLICESGLSVGDANSGGLLSSSDPSKLLALSQKGLSDVKVHGSSDASEEGWLAQEGNSRREQSNWEGLLLCKLWADWVNHLCHPRRNSPGCFQREGVAAVGVRLTVSLYFMKLNVMLAHSNFIFSKFFSREYSLLAAAPMGSSLKRQKQQQRCEQGRKWKRVEGGIQMS